MVHARSFEPWLGSGFVFSDSSVTCKPCSSNWILSPFSYTWAPPLVCSFCSTVPQAEVMQLTLDFPDLSTRLFRVQLSSSIFPIDCWELTLKDSSLRFFICIKYWDKKIPVKYPQNIKTKNIMNIEVFHPVTTTEKNYCYLWSLCPIPFLLYSEETTLLKMRNDTSTDIWLETENSRMTKIKLSKIKINPST